LPGRAPVDVVLAITWAVCSPEAVLLARRPTRLLGPQVLPHAIEQLNGPAPRPRPRHVPAMLPVGLAIGESAESADHDAHALGGKSRDDGAGWRLVERAELVREARHGAPDAHAAGLHAPAHVVDGAALHDVAIDDRTPAADLHETLRVTVVLGEDALLVESGPRAALMHGVAEEPRRPAELVEGRQRPQTLQEEQHGEHRLGKVVSLRRTPRDIDHGQT